MSPATEFLLGAARIVIGGCLTVLIYDWAARKFGWDK